MPVPSPRLAFKQPEALCRTYVYSWGGCLLGTGFTETNIMAGLNFGTTGSPLDSSRADHKHKTKTKSYVSPMRISGTTKVSDAYSYAGYEIVHHQDFASINDAEQLARNKLRKMFDKTSGQQAFALSLHYEYPHNHHTSAHCVGFFYSNGGIGTRKPGGRFFDPNYGSWQFGSGNKLLDFYCDEWLPNFLAGTVNPDPGHRAGRARELTFFRLSGLMQA